MRFLIQFWFGIWTCWAEYDKSMNSLKEALEESERRLMLADKRQRALEARSQMVVETEAEVRKALAKILNAQQAMEVGIQPLVIIIYYSSNYSISHRWEAIFGMLDELFLSQATEFHIYISGNPFFNLLTIAFLHLNLACYFALNPFDFFILHSLYIFHSHSLLTIIVWHFFYQFIKYM